MGRVVTAADVAARAGVSRATVSYVLNHTSGQTISAATSEAVLRAADELEYLPNHFARSLKRGRGGTVLFPLPGAGFTAVLAGVVDACAATLAGNGLTLLTDFTRYATPEDRIAAWLRLQPAAVIDLFLPGGDPAIAPLRATGAVVLTTTAAGESAGDHIAMSARVTQLDYLLNSGHRRIVLAGEAGATPTVEHRLLQRLQRRARARGASLRRIKGTFDRAGVDAVVEGLGDADAVCASNDDFAVALLGALAARDVAVPGDLAVVGVDDRPIGAASTPTLTSVSASFDQWGVAIAEHVVRGLEGQPIGELPPLETLVVVRESA